VHGQTARKEAAFITVLELDNAATAIGSCGGGLNRGCAVPLATVPPYLDFVGSDCTAEAGVQGSEIEPGASWTHRNDDVNFVVVGNVGAICSGVRIGKFDDARCCIETDDAQIVQAGRLLNAK
jgi:hypothetical protein